MLSGVGGAGSYLVASAYHCADGEPPCTCSLCSSRIIFCALVLMLVFNLLLLAGIKVSIVVRFVASLASLSTRSFPAMFTWLGIQCKATDPPVSLMFWAMVCTLVISFVLSVVVGCFRA